jgi:hypothetical protein
MFWAGVALVAVGLVWSVVKGWVVWGLAHDLYRGGGTPTLDFPLFCPLPLAAGVFALGSDLVGRPVPLLALAVYVTSAVIAGVLLWWFDHLGAAERQRQLEAITPQTPPATANVKPSE